MQSTVVSLFISLFTVDRAFGLYFCPDGTRLPPIHLQYVHLHDLSSFPNSTIRNAYLGAVPKVFSSLQETFGEWSDFGLRTFGNKPVADPSHWCDRIELPLAPFDWDTTTAAIDLLGTSTAANDLVIGSLSDALYRMLNKPDQHWSYKNFDDHGRRFIRVISIATDAKSFTENDDSLTIEFPKLKYPQAGREDCSTFDYPSAELLRKTFDDFPLVGLVFHVSSDKSSDIANWYNETFMSEFANNKVPFLIQSLPNTPEEIETMLVEGVRAEVCVNWPIAATCKGRENALIYYINANNK